MSRPQAAYSPSAEGKACTPVSNRIDDARGDLDAIRRQFDLSALTRFEHERETHDGKTGEEDAKKRSRIRIESLYQNLARSRRWGLQPLARTTHEFGERFATRWDFSGRT